MNLNFSERLLEGEKQFQLLADFVPQLMWLANPDGWIYWYNKSCYDYSGTTAEQIAGWGWQVAIDPVALPAVMERWTRAIANGRAIRNGVSDQGGRWKLPSLPVACSTA